MGGSDWNNVRVLNLHAWILIAGAFTSLAAASDHIPTIDPNHFL